MPPTHSLNASPSGYAMLTDAQLEEIHHASLKILRRTGVRVFEQEARELLADAGCSVTDKDLVMIPGSVVEDALLQAPSGIVLSTRTGQEALHLEGHRSYFGTGSDLPFTLDLETGKRRSSVVADIGRAARLADALPNLDFVMSMAQASDVGQETSDRRAFLEMISNTTKPVVFTAWNEHGLADIIDMAEEVAGGAEPLAQSPFLLAYLEPTSPLQHAEEVLKKMLLMADKGLPFVYAPGPIEGASAPMTSAGSLALANAEVLSGLAIAQLRRPGTPFLYGSGAGPLDMKTAVSTYFGPEFMRHCMATAELAHRYYDLPVWGFSGCSDAKVPDVQAGIESALWILWTMLSGANLVHDIGYLESGLTCSLEMMVVCDEIIGCARKMLSPFDTSREALALEVIDRVGPGGDFLGDAHTLRHFRQCWSPTILDRRTHEMWAAAGSPSAAETGRERALEIIGRHTPEPLEQGMLKRLQKMLAEADLRSANERRSPGA